MCINQDGMESGATKREIFDRREYEKIFHAYYSQLCLFANRMLDDFAGAEDIVQEVFVSLFSKRVLNNAIELKSYLYSSVYNACMNHLKRQKYIEGRMQSFPVEELTEENYLLNRIESEVMEEIFRTIELLPEECKKVFKLSYIEGLEVNKVAALLNISENTVKTQRQRARRFLQERLKDVFFILFLLFPHFR